MTRSVRTGINPDPYLLDGSAFVEAGFIPA